MQTITSGKLAMALVQVQLAVIHQVTLNLLLNIINLVFIARALVYL